MERQRSFFQDETAFTKAVSQDPRMMLPSFFTKETRSVSDHALLGGRCMF
jgi:hypothetical protein